MATSNAPVGGRKSKRVAELDELLLAREECEARIKRAAGVRDAAIGRAKRRYDEAVGETPKELEAIDEQLRLFLGKHRPYLMRRLSKTMRRPSGEVKVTLRAEELELPADATPVIDLLLERSGGKRYLRRKWELDLRALLQAPRSVMDALAPLGVWRGKHRTISVKSLSSDKPKTLSRRRFNDRTSSRRR